MKLKTMGLMMLLACIISGFTSVARAEAPVAKLVQVEGDVQYTRNGSTWRPVNRTKYLFEGYQIKTGADGKGKLINQETGMSQDLGVNSVIEVGKGDVEVLVGSLSKPEKESGSLFQSLMNKFAKAQRYTTVRRNVGDPAEGVCDNKVRTISKVALSASHPDLVWRNACPEYSYRLVIAGQTYDIPAQSTAEMIRFTVPAMKPGEYEYHVEVLDKDGTVYIPRSESTFVWLDESSEKKLKNELAAFGDDVFLKTNLLESKEMHIAAMDEYRNYFQENPDDNDMRPLLINSYQELKLSNLREREARLYNAALEEDF